MSAAPNEVRGADGGAGRRTIRLLVTDVDGTILTSERTIAPSTIEAARLLKEAGVALAITSSRPPRGLTESIQALGVELPSGAFNGGTFVQPDLTIVSEVLLPADAARDLVALIEGQGLDVWVYCGDDWYVHDLQGSHVQREVGAVHFEPDVLESYEPVIDRVVKIVGVTDDPALMEKAHDAVEARFGASVSATRSQTYYLDITHPEANKGHVLAWMSEYLDIDPEDIATIGDGPNDILMFRRSGLSIAMSGASPEVKAEATVITSSNDEDGWARAVETHILSKHHQGG